MSVPSPSLPVRRTAASHLRSRRPVIASERPDRSAEAVDSVAIKQATAPTESTLDVAAVRQYLLGLQTRIVDALTAFDGGPFRRDAWMRPAGEALTGDGITWVIEEGGFFERGGCNFSHVRGAALPESASAGRRDVAGRPFEALGVSLVLHPRNPYCPTTHMNVRLFIVHPAEGSGAAPTFWFGGGMDLTPFYGFDDDVRHFHRTCADALAPFGDELYPAFKLWCDAYFHLPHRDEPRGVGGIFFDDFADFDFDGSFAMLCAVGDAFLDAYLPILKNRRSMPYGERERTFQSIRRGRYVEFNLLQDRGTVFGLKGGGRTESILMSLPPHPTWRYDWTPEPDSAEALLHSRFLKPRDWLAVSAAESE
jgi:coproporphyrinogen III oxidase